jgi:protein FAM50
LEPKQPPKKKPKKNAAKGKLSFALDEEEEDGSSTSAAPTPRSLSRTPDVRSANEDGQDSDGVAIQRKKLGPRAGVQFVPRAKTKAAIIQDAQNREKIRKEYVTIQERVKNTEIMVPFVFYDGTNSVGGKCKLRKGDNIYHFLDKARKVGAELGVGGEKARREWARISVDDLMLVKGEIIIPHVS